MYIYIIWGVLATSIVEQKGYKYRVPFPTGYDFDMIISSKFKSRRAKTNVY